MLAGFALATACSEPSRESPKPLEVLPARAIEGATVEVTIRGEHFHPRVFTDFQRSEAGRVDDDYQVRLGTTRLRNVRRDPDGTLHAIVPETLPPGRHDLTVVDPWGGEGRLAAAFWVLSAEDAHELIAGYRFEPVGPQYAFAPFRIDVSAVDAEGQIVELFNGAVTLTDRTGTIVPGVAGFFSWGRWSGEVELRAPILENVLTVTDATGKTGVSNAFLVATREPVRVRFATTARTVLAGACSAAVQINLVDAIGAPTPAPADVPLSLTKDPVNGVELFADPGCTQPLGNAAVRAKQTSMTFHFRGQRAGTVRVHATSDALIGDTQDQTVVAANASRLTVLTAPQQLQAGTCSGQVLVELQDAWGNRQAASTPLAAALSATPTAGLTFYGDPSCSTPVSALNLDVGDSEGVFYFRGTVSGQVTLNVAAAALAPASQTQVIVPGPPAELVFTSSAQTRVLGTCSLPVTFEVRDVHGNASPSGAGVSVSLGVTPSPGLTFSADPSCTSVTSSVAIAPSTTGGTFYFQGQLEGVYTVTVSAAGLTGAAQTQTVTPPPPDRLVFTTAPQTVVAGRCSGMATLQAQDETNTPRVVQSDTTVALGAPSGSGLRFFSDPSCVQEVSTRVMTAQTHTTSFFFRSTVAGTHAVTAAVSGWTSGVQAQTIVADVAVQIGFATPARTAFAGSCSTAVEVELQDAYGNRSPTATSVTVGLAATPSQGFGLFGDGTCTTPTSSLVFPAGTATASAWFLGTVAGEIALNGYATGYLDGTQTQTVTASVPHTLVFTTAPRVTAAGLCSDPITVQAKDIYGNPAPVSTATPVALTATPSGAFTFSVNGACSTATTEATIAPGADTATFYVRGTTARDHTIEATAFNDSVDQLATITPADTAKFTWGALASPRPAAAPFAVSVQARDVYDNLTPAWAGTATLSLNPAGSVSCVSGCSSSSATALFVSGAWQGEVQIGAAGSGIRLVATSGTISGTSAPFDVAAAPSASAPTAVLRATPGAVVVGDPVVFDASGSSDYQNASGALEVSWDFTGTAVGPPPWSPWSATLTALHVYSTAGQYHARIALRDASGDIGYARIPIEVVATTSEICVVTTTSESDDGATSCTSPGPDGQLSLVESVRLANATSDLTVSFVAPMSIPGSAPLLLSQPTTIAGGGNVTLGATFEVTTSARIFGVDFDANGTSRVLPSGALTMMGSTLQGTKLVAESASSVTLQDVQLSGCPGTCIEDRSSDTLVMQHVSFVGDGSAAGLELTSCGGTANPVAIRSSVFRNLGDGIRALCPRTIDLRHGTFHANSHAVVYAGGTGHVLVDSIFTQHGSEAVICGTATFSQRERHLLHQNAAATCLTADPQTVSASPEYLFPAAEDFRLAPISPAVDSASAAGLDVNGPGPGDHFGVGPDRGALESH